MCFAYERRGFFVKSCGVFCRSGCEFLRQQHPEMDILGPRASGSGLLCVRTLQVCSKYPPPELSRVGKQFHSSVCTVHQ